MKNKAMQEAFAAWYEQDDTDSFAACWEAACAWSAVEKCTIETNGLKPCPFCGSAAEDPEVFQIEAATWNAAISCSGCDAMVEDKYGEKSAEMAIDSVTTLWNRRPAPEALCAAKGGLSDAEILDVASDHVDRYGWINGNDALAFARAILAKAKDQS